MQNIFIDILKIMFRIYSVKHANSPKM